MCIRDSPFNDEDVVAGQGTIALEILRDIPTVDTVIIPAGGGGLLAGMAFCIKQINPCLLYTSYPVIMTIIIQITAPQAQKRCCFKESPPYCAYILADLNIIGYLHLFHLLDSDRNRRGWTIFLPLFSDTARA